MEDGILPIEHQVRPLRSIFLDLNSYFASVEQNERPELRGRPVIVVPVEADTTFAIAASYEAKAFGIKTGTQVGEAKRMCRDLCVVRARPRMYLAYHQQILAALEKVLPIDKVCSIDEMRFRLLASEQSVTAARSLAFALKEQLRQSIGPCIRASIGIAPNHFLAKIATELEKPDGLVIITQQDLPTALDRLKLTDFTGINRRMQARLNAHGIFTAAQLTAASREQLRTAFGSIIGERWWYLLRGFELPEEETDRKTLGHSHVLPPDLRTDTGCREVLLRLIQKATARLRATGLHAGAMAVGVHGFERSWKAKTKFEPTQDTVRINDHFLTLWRDRDFRRPRSVAVTFFDLHEANGFTPSLFETEEPDRGELMKAIDAVNQKFGKQRIFLAGMERAKDAAEERIAFTKTWLFPEGKEDHADELSEEWVDTFRGLAS